MSTAVPRRVSCSQVASTCSRRRSFPACSPSRRWWEQRWCNSLRSTWRCPSFQSHPSGCSFAAQKSRRWVLRLLPAMTAQGFGGETCLSDFRKVYQGLRPALRQKFEEKGVRNGARVVSHICADADYPQLQQEQVEVRHRCVETEGVGGRVGHGRQGGHQQGVQLAGSGTAGCVHA